MKKKDKIKTALITSIIIVFSIIVSMGSIKENKANKVYQIYLNGNKIGLIQDREELYKLINEEQKDIKENYQVSNVYPPNGFEISEIQTYNEKITSAKDIYEKIKEVDDFTIEGYSVKIKFNEEGKEDIILYVLNKDIFEKAIVNVVTAFVDENKFTHYINNTQEPIEDVGQIIEKMYFEETITLKESHISVNEKIFTDALELTQYLLFGTSKQQSGYKVKEGDTIVSIAEENKLNTKEFLIANPKYKNENSILAIGEEVNITLINPVLSFVQNIYSVSDEEQVYETETIYDKTKPYTFSEVTQTGISGIDRISQRLRVVNGEQTQGSEPISTITIRERQNEITTKGGTASFGHFEDNGKSWGWPTNRPYVITTGFEWRWGSFHDAIDISGTGMGSPIYASRKGTIVETFSTCPNVGYYHSTCGGSYGNYVVIKHDNGYHTIYAHMLQNLTVNVGDTVDRGQIIGFMGSSGSSTGTHLHFGVSTGEPNRSTWLNPWSLFR